MMPNSASTAVTSPPAFSSTDNLCFVSDSVACRYTLVDGRLPSRLSVVWYVDRRTGMGSATGSRPVIPVDALSGLRGQLLLHGLCSGRSEAPYGGREQWSCGSQHGVMVTVVTGRRLCKWQRVDWMSEPDTDSTRRQISLPSFIGHARRSLLLHPWSLLCMTV